MSLMGCSLQPRCNPAGSHSMALHPAASAVAESLLEKQILNLPRLTESEILGLGPTICLWRNPPGNSCCCGCLVSKSCQTLCNPVDCGPPDSSVHNIFQARILEWVAISSSGGSSRLRDWTSISRIGRQILYHWATWEALSAVYFLPNGDRGGEEERKEERHRICLVPIGLGVTVQPLYLWWSPFTTLADCQ